MQIWMENLVIYVYIILHLLF